ncbi:MAG: APC family permease [Terriglobales bacterium]
MPPAPESGPLPAPAATTGGQLLPELGRGDLTALVVNTVIGSGIFGLPMLITGLLGSASALGYLAAAIGIGFIVLCFAEVSAQFRAAGGPYLYAREAFGRFVGVLVGWVTWLMRITAAAATARIFVSYLAVFWPAASKALAQAVLITLLFAALGAINYRGVRAGARTSDVLVIAKLIPLALFVGIGLWFVRGANFFTWKPAGGAISGNWFEAVLLLIFAFGGFDNAMFPGSEMRNPRRDTPFALLSGMGIVVVFYFLIQVVFQGTVSPAGVSAAVKAQPLAAAAARFLGLPGAWLMALGAMISIWGWFAATILGTPRLTFAMGERGDLPRVLCAVHRRFRTPHVSILLYVIASWALAMAGSFEWNASLSAVARLLTYGFTCAALPVFRRRDPGAPVFRVPLGWLVPALGVGFCLVLLTQMDRTDMALLSGTIALAAVSWLLTRPRAAAGAP